MSLYLGIPEKDRTNSLEVEMRLRVLRVCNVPQMF